MKVSAIIPMYNAEKYLSVCLESLLIQTFQDFEVVVVDDCSTDNSVAIAESYLEKFGGRLKIISLEENTGSGAVPRNIGLEFSSGEYVYFVDADDLLIDTALETLYNYAEEYQAEIVYMELGFHCGEEIIPLNLTEVSWNPPKFVSSAPQFEDDDISKRIDKLFRRAIAVTTCTKFLRRDFLVNNGIKFPNIKPAEDIIWTIKLLCLAKKILRVPSPLYVYRLNTDSVTRKKRTPEQELIFWTKPLLHGVEILNDFMNRFELFNQKNNLRLRVLNFFAKIQFDFMANVFKNLEPQEAYEIFLREFSRAGSSQPALIAYLLVMNNLYRNELAK